jgi:hypothetical protein
MALIGLTLGAISAWIAMQPVQAILFGLLGAGVRVLY